MDVGLEPGLLSHAISVPLTCNRVPPDVLQSETHTDGGIGWATEDQLRLAWACKPRVYLGDYSVRGRGTRGLATGLVSGPEEDLTIQFNPAIEPGQTVNLVFRGFNPQFSIYQWSTQLMADGEDPVRYVGPTLRLNVYEQDPYR